jgi:uncharacterized protein YbjT (DUF2867 family)
MTENANKTVLVTGASGTLGSAVVPVLEKAGYRVRPMSRHAKPGWVVGDLRTGEGLAEAVEGVDVIVHLASSAGKPRQTDVEGTERLLAVAKPAGVRHVLYISINGLDRVPFGYYQAKLDTEKVVQRSGIPYTILRAAQFHPFVEMLVSASSKLGPVIIDPSWRVQPVAIEDVAGRIAELLAVPPTGQIIEYAGPQVITFDEIARSWLTARRAKRPVWRLRIPGRMAKAVRDGALTTPATTTGTRSWEDYLATKY